MKKISLIVTSLVFCIAAVFIFPAKEAKANPLAVGGALYLGGAGVYVVGATAIAGIAGLAGCTSCQRDIEAHAQRTWSGTTALAKAGMQKMIDASVSVGNALTVTDSSFNTWMNSQLDSIAALIATSASTPNSGTTVDGSSSVTQLPQSYVTSFSTTAPLYFKYNNATLYSAGSIKADTTQIILTISGGSTVGVNHNSTRDDVYKLLNASTNVFQVAQIWNSFSTIQLTVTSNSTSWNNQYVAAKAKVTEAWEDMIDAGLVLPTDNARPLAGNVPLTYDPVTDTYAGIDGITVPHEDVTGFEYQKPHWKTLDDLAALGLAGLGAGLYIDGWPGTETSTSTYDPVTDTTTTVTTTGTTTNVTTGETAITGTTTTTTTGDTTGNPPVNPPTASKPGDPLNPFKAKPMPIAALTGLFQLLAALIFYLIRMFTFISTIAFIAPTPIDNPYFLWFTTATFQGITPFPLVRNLALFFLGFSVYKSVRRVFG